MDNVINKLITDYNIYSLMVARCSRILQTTSDNKVKEKIWRKWKYLRNKRDNIEKSIIEIIVEYDLVVNVVRKYIFEEESDYFGYLVYSIN